MRIRILLIITAMVFASSLSAKLSKEEQFALVRALTAEFGVAKALIPRAKKPLEVTPEGRIDRDEWGEQMRENGPAARLGDMVQITKVTIKKDRLILQLNHGIKGGRKWWHNVEVSGTSNRGTTLGANQATHAPGGTDIALVFDKELPKKEDPKEYLKLLGAVLDFDQRSADEVYLEKLEPEFREAIEKKEVVVGMDRDMVLISKDRPDRKVRDFKDGVETEDWIYGTPPGEVVFVTFEDGKVINVKYAHAAPGGQVAVTEPIKY